VKLKLPDPLPLTCPACRLELRLDPAVLQQLRQLSCPRCVTVHQPYYWLPASLRQEVSARIRSRIYFGAHQMNSGLEDQSNGD